MQWPTASRRRAQHSLRRVRAETHLASLHSRVQETFPDAAVETACVPSSSVKITSGKTEIIKVSQRDLYRKYQWPAAPKIKQYLEAFKEENED